MKLLFLLACIGLAAGCAQTRTYAVRVHNDASQPIMLWLCKAGGPYQDGWKSPEDIAIESPNHNEPLGGVVVRPGKTATAGPIEGKFDPKSQAILRVYLGVHPFDELLAIGVGSADRRDLVLPQGHSAYIVTDHDGKLAVESMLPPEP